MHWLQSNFISTCHERDSKETDYAAWLVDDNKFPLLVVDDNLDRVGCYWRFVAVNDIPGQQI